MTATEYWSNDGDGEFQSLELGTKELLTDIEGYFSSRNQEKYLFKKYQLQDELKLHERIAACALTGLVSLSSVYFIDQLAIGLSVSMHLIP
jgi:hypothetical protein